MVDYIIQKYLSSYTISYKLIILGLMFSIPLMIFSKKVRKTVEVLSCLAGVVFTALLFNHYKLISLSTWVYDFLISFVRFGLESLQHLTIETVKIHLFVNSLDKELFALVSCVSFAIFLIPTMYFVLTSCRLFNDTILEEDNNETEIITKDININITKPILLTTKMIC